MMDKKKRNSYHDNKETYQHKSEAASPPAGINKVLSVDGAREVIST